jgi:hypothetical protein
MVKPIIVFLYNRPNQTKEILGILSRVRTKKLYISIDGPKESKEGDDKLVEKVESIANTYNYTSKFEIWKSPSNKGCQASIKDGLDRFFQLEEAGIILEDDTIPSESFFHFCSDLLDKYRDTQEIMHIGGNNFAYPEYRTDNSYFFSVLNHIWGWATWRQSWTKFASNYDESLEPKVEAFVNNNRLFSTYIESIKRTYNGEIDSWGYQWTYTCWLNEGISILPKKNMVKNIGFGHQATHTTGKDPYLSSLKTHDLVFPLKHPKRIKISRRADNVVSKRFYSRKRNLVRRGLNKVVRVLKKEDF